MQYRTLGLAVLALGLIAASVCADWRDATAVDVQVSPGTLLLSSDQGGQVSVHTNIPYLQVNAGSVQLSGIPVVWTKADSQGNLVAKFDESAVKAIVQPGRATLTLTGLYLNGVGFSGSDTVTVRR